MDATDLSPRPRLVVVTAYDGVQSLDLTGPLEVFVVASQVLASAGERAGYQVMVAAERPGPVRTSSGLVVVADAGRDELTGDIDTLLVPGGSGSRQAVRDEEFLGWVASAAGRSRRVASVCSGAFVLAAAGLLDGRRATTHWAHCDSLARAYPAVRVEPGPIYTRDGDVWTSAGVTAGIDLALALVDADLGRDVALAVARWLVMFLHRPGDQAQFSAALAGQAADRAEIRAVQSWLVDHVDADLSVDALARRSAMSPRTFARAFRREVGTTPGRYVEKVRVEAARRRLVQSDDGVDRVATRCGFGTAETMRRSFVRVLGVPPTDYRRRFTAPPPSPPVRDADRPPPARALVPSPAARAPVSSPAARAPVSSPAAHAPVSSLPARAPVPVPAARAGLQSPATGAGLTSPARVRARTRVVQDPAPAPAVRAGVPSRAAQAALLSPAVRDLDRTRAVQDPASTA